MATVKAALTPQALTGRISVVRGQRVMLDSDLAELYEVETKVFNQAVKRNTARFPEDFMFRLTAEEFAALRSQNVTSKRGGRRYAPLAFTEHGALRRNWISWNAGSPITTTHWRKSSMPFGR